jgi:hypothetical protein
MSGPLVAVLGIVLSIGGLSILALPPLDRPLAWAVLGVVLVAVGIGMNHLGEPDTEDED